MDLKKINIFRKKPWPIRQFHLAVKYLRKLLGLRLVQIVIAGIVVVIILPVFLFILWRPKPIDHINYGITYSNKYATELGLDWRETYLAILDDLKVPHLRLVAYWDEVEPQNDQYDFSTIRWQLDEAKQRNIPVIMILGRKQVRYPECFEPEWWKSIDDEATQDAELFDYIKNTMNNLKEYDNIVMWQVENEPFFPFGTCAGEIKWSTLNKEVAIVRQLDSRPIIIQDSGEGGVWLPTYLAGDYLAISMYRRIWYDFWGLIFGKPIYFQYPLAHWTYKIKAELTHVPYEKIFVTELQAEPWGPAISSKLTREEKDKTMSRELFIDTINYAQKAGFENLYFWGAEWWYFEKTQLNEPFFWDTAKALFN